MRKIGSAVRPFSRSQLHRIVNNRPTGISLQYSGEGKRAHGDRARFRTRESDHSLVGLAVGAIAGLIYYNSNVTVDDEGSESLGAPTPSTAVKLGVGMLGVLRLIAD